MIHAEVYLGTGMAKPITNIEIKFNRIRRLAKISISLYLEYGLSLLIIIPITIIVTIIIIIIIIIIITTLFTIILLDTRYIYYTWYSHILCQIHHYSRFSLDVTNIQTKELSIDLSFYFREVLPQQNGFS